MVWFQSSRVWPLVIAQTSEIEWHIVLSKNILNRGRGLTVASLLLGLGLAGGYPYPSFSC